MDMMLDVEKLYFSYDGKRVLRDISFSLDRGEMICVMGPNGSGKSTLIECILGLLRPESGNIFLDGRNVRDMSRPEIAKLAAFVPQDHRVAFPYTVREAVMMGRTAYVPAFGTPPEDSGELCDAALRRVGIEHLADKAYSSISGGELRLVILARALCQNAPMILMDEPTAHLDCRNEAAFLDMAARLCLEDGRSVLMATHDPAHAFYLESRGMNVRVIFLKEGETAAAGGTAEVVTPEMLESVFGVKTKILGDTDGKAILMKGFV